MAKDFYKVSELTHEIEGDLRNIQSAGYPAATQATALTLAAQVRVQLAIAQQLSVISGHLAEVSESLRDIKRINAALVGICENQLSRKEL